MAERLNYNSEPDTRQVGDHLYRYWLACQEMKGMSSVVDAGCGYGFGSDLLSRYCDLVFAVDYNESCINEVFDKFNDKGNIVTQQCDFNYDRLPEAQVLVCFEVIEHLELPINLINQFDKYKKVIISTPIIPTKHTNSFHLQDFTEKQVLSWFNKGWKIKWTKKQHDEVYLIICAEKLS